MIKARVSLGQRDYFKRLRDDPALGMVIAEPLVGAISQRWMWLMARRIHQPDGAFGGLVYASIFVDEIVRTFDQIRMSPNSVIALLDQDMRLVARRAFNSSTPLPIGEKATSPAFAQAFSRNQQQGMFDTGYGALDGVRRLYCYRRNAKYGFLIQVGSPMSYVTAQWQQQAMMMSAVLAAFIMAALTFARSLINYDITQQRRAHERMEFLASYDSLTGLPNRRLGQDRLEHGLSAASRHQTMLAVLYLDLDKFKYVNATHGFSVGDLLLKSVALRLRERLRPEDTLCRLSGDEFLMVLPNLRAEHPVAQAAKVCEDILAGLAAPFDLDGRQLFGSASIGVVIYPEDADTAEGMLRNAHIALNEAKRAGNSGYRFFEAQMNAELRRFVETREALRCAVERREFELHYQPQVDLNSGRVVGVEALLRWRRPGAQLTMPDAFINVAEESGLIAPIGRWVLREACRQAAAWHAAGWPGLVMAVNLSAVQFREGRVGADVLAALDESGLDAAFLELELTESILLQPQDYILNTLACWKSRGIQLSIDDFGTGYSSLAYLKRFRVDKLKIDRSFVENFRDDEEDRTIVFAIIQLARSLNLRTIAEGVEDAAVAQHLKSMGCDEVQGYLYAKPLAAADLVSWLTDWGGRVGDVAAGLEK
ncbi:EAL domain-containing protein [uncultured Thiodictyon sp.]|uniref:putative bifunctional diguanylate cyclase/phosphodiesterase n=1 Tax=uncultured Thiodictyon sp. TaxID=1846217 RepID=UPI0025FB0D4F|nr:EAL domain-containing protein [uncultured Thiodictyon sp.]